MSTPGAEVNVRTKADLAALREAIAGFKEGRVSLEQLKKAAEDVKTATKEQSTAINLLGRATRAQNFELLEFARGIRSITSLARDLNQVYQTIVLRNIEQSQTTRQQKEAYEELTGQLEKVANALSILGPSEEVKEGLKDIAGSASDLSSVQLDNLISQANRLKSSLNLTPEQRDALNEFISKLKEIKKEQLSEEQIKQWENFFGIFSTGALAAGGIAQFAANFSKISPALAGIAATVGRFRPELGIIILLLFGMPVAKELGLIQTAGGGEEVDKLEQILSGNLEIPEIQSRFTEGQLQRMGLTKIEFNNNTFFADVDVARAIQKAIEEYERVTGKKFQ